MKFNWFNKKSNGKDLIENSSNPLTREIAVRDKVINSISSYLNELPDPDPILRKLSNGNQILEDLLADEHVFSVVTRRKNGVKRLQWQFAADKDAQKELDFVKLAFDLFAEQTKISDLISQSLNPIFFGFSVFEIVWKKYGKYFIPERIEEKPRDYFGFDNNGNLFYKGELGKERIYITGNDIPSFITNKFILLRNEPTYSNPYGSRALSRTFWAVTFKRGGLKFWATFIEKYGMPYLFGKLPRGASEKEHLDLLDKLDNMVADGIGTMPDDASVEILDVAKSSSGEIYQNFINQLNNSISKAILTNTLSTELQQEGSRAATETHRNAELALADMDKYFTSELFNEIIKRIIDLNFSSGKYPYFIDIKQKSVNKEIAERDKTLAEMGVKFSKNYFLKTYGFEKDDLEIQEITPQKPSNFTENADKIFPPEAILNSIPDSELQKQIETLLNPVLTDIKNGLNYEQIMEKLASILPNRNTTELENILSKLIFISEITGATK